MGGAIVATPKNVYVREWLERRGLLRGDQWRFAVCSGRPPTNVRRAQKNDKP